MSETVLAAVKVAPESTELREFQMPDVPIDGALMKVEAAGVCGSDPGAYRRAHSDCIMGHEMTGLPTPVLGNVEAMSMHDSGDTLTFVMATTQGEVYASEDDGANWNLIASGLPPVSKSAHFRKFLTDDERARFEAELHAELQRESASAV